MIQPSRLLFFLLTFVLTFVSPAFAAAKKPLLLAFYHPWYGTPTGSAGTWFKWDSYAFPDRYDPTRIKANGQRDIASPDYPLIGTYDNGDPEIVRWHFRLAKAAGIDGFLCSWWKYEDGKSRPWPDWQADLFEKVFLPIAQEENFKIAVIDENAHYVANYDALLHRITNSLPRFAKHLGYLKINGQPAWFIYQVWDDWLTADQATKYVTAAEKQVGDVFWMFDKLKAAATGKEPGVHLSVKPEWLAIPKIDCFGTYSYFGHWRDVRPQVLAEVFSDYAKSVHSAGKKVQMPISPSHNNTPVHEAPLLIPRNDGETLRTFIKAAEAAKPDISVVCSWNEWLEGTEVEPMRHVEDPYYALKILAKWRGQKWKTPPLPKAPGLDALR